MNEPPRLVRSSMTSPYTLPASAYLALANKQQGQERQSLQLMACGRLIEEGRWQEATRILAQMSALPPELARDQHILLAKIDLMRGQPKTAIGHLANIQQPQSLTQYHQVQYYEMLAKAYRKTGHVENAALERIKLDKLLADQKAKTNNLKALWMDLSNLSPAQLNTMRMETDDHADWQGWLQLATIARRSYDDASQLLATLDTWKTHYPNHPAQAIIHPHFPEQLLPNKPKQVALLLPLTGPLSGPGQAVRDGFISAAQSDTQGKPIQVRTYDTHEANPAQLYQQALSEGADYVVGPLAKQEVAAIAALPHPVPTLLLNDVSRRTPTNAFQFGLSPTHEAREVAVQAAKKGLRRVLVIAPDGSWGRDVSLAFSKEWQAQGGTIVDALYYQNQASLNDSIKNLLHINESESRQKKLKQLLGKHLEFVPRRRQDFDMIFLLAYPSKARQIMPLLKYYYAGNVPVYATSSVYAGNPNSMKDRDLNGIIFCDLPWVFNHHIGNKHWPEQFNSYNRLYALGLDSYALSKNMNQLLVFPAMGLSQDSGLLYYNQNGEVTRMLAWGQFKQGIPQRLDHQV